MQPCVPFRFSSLLQRDLSPGFLDQFSSSHLTEPNDLETIDKRPCHECEARIYSLQLKYKLLVLCKP